MSWDRPQSPEEAEREYNPRLSVPEAGAITAAWSERAARARARRPPLPEIRYGDHPRETLDLFRAASPRGAVLFVHGGYWRAFSKDDVSWVADGFLDQGLSVAILNYPLCPDVPLARVCEAAIRAFVALHGRLTPPERDRIVVAGHSAGGYLAALHLATDWASLGLPADPIRGVVPVSGVFALTPLLRTSMNDAIRLGPADAEALSLDRRPWRSRAGLVFAVGAEESSAFRLQSHGMAAAWRDLRPETIEVAGRNHFDVIDDLAVPGSALNGAVLRLAAP